MALFKEIRQYIQPDFETVATGIRRIYKHQMASQSQVEAKFRSTDQRLSDSFTLAAAAARGSANPWNILRRLVNDIASLLFLPVSLPLTVLAMLFSHEKGRAAVETSRRGSRFGKTSSQSRLAMERTPRLSKR